MQTPTERHLDIGCGSRPKNPYNKQFLYGIDIRNIPSTDAITFKQANLTLDSIPFEDNYFGTVSAFDFIEHIPRVFPSKDGKDTVFPFINLMSEVWRVLEHGGRFYALTPAYPNIGAFIDPTHVNFITDKTHTYFCVEYENAAAMYGFKGQFKLIRCEWVKFSYGMNPKAKLSVLQRLKVFINRKRNKVCHLVWELEAIKHS